MTSLDATDRQILRLLQTDARRTTEDIGAEVGLSASATYRRIQRLRDQNVIIGEISLVDPRAVGRPMVMIVQLRVDREGRREMTSLRAWLRAEPRIQQGWYVTGESDFVVVVTARNMDDFDDLMQHLISDNGNVRQFHTSVAISTMKRGLGIAVDE